MIELTKQSAQAGRRLRLAAIAGLAIASVASLRVFLELYLLDDPLKYERHVLALAATVHLALVASRAGYAPEPRRMGWVMGALAVFVAALTVVPSHALAMYAFLGYFAALMAVACGPVVGRAAAITSAGLALLIYPPRVVYEPTVEWLRDGTFAVSGHLVKALLPGVTLGEHVFRAGGQIVEFTTSCAGSNFLMALAALTLIVLARAGWRRILVEAAIALVLGFTLNIVRVFATMWLVEGGHLRLALGSGHAMVGEGFIFVGVLGVLWRAELKGRSTR